MTENEFLTLADKTLEELENKIEDSSPDCDCLREGNVLNVETPDGKTLVLNIQSATEEIWLASPQGGSRYAYEQGKWKNTRTHTELCSDVLSQVGES